MFCRRKLEEAARGSQCGLWYFWACRRKLRVSGSGVSCRERFSNGAVLVSNASSDFACSNGAVLRFERCSSCFELR
eukprot:10368223-Alexandrium_andersonii.AAC.1